MMLLLGIFGVYNVGSEVKLGSNCQFGNIVLYMYMILCHYIIIIFNIPSPWKLLYFWSPGTNLVFMIWKYTKIRFPVVLYP